MHYASVRAIVEVEKGSHQRAAFDENFKVLGYREVGLPYPFAYGFILNTSSEDGDGIDCYILTDKHLEIGTIVGCIPIGLLEVYENEELDSKVICIVENDNFRFNQKHIERIKNFILLIFEKYPDINIKFGEYRDGDYAGNYISERGPTSNLTKTGS